MNETGWLTITELAELFEVSRQTAWRWIKEEIFPSETQGNVTLVSVYHVYTFAAWRQRHEHGKVKRGPVPKYVNDGVRTKIIKKYHRRFWNRHFMPREEFKPRKNLLVLKDRRVASLLDGMKAWKKCIDSFFELIQAKEGDRPSPEAIQFIETYLERLKITEDDLLKYLTGYAIAND